MAARHCTPCQIYWPQDFLKPKPGYNPMTPMFPCVICGKITALDPEAEPISDKHAEFEVRYAKEWEKGGREAWQAEQDRLVAELERMLLDDQSREAA